MQIHICTENPCPLQDAEIYEMLKNGFEVEYAVEEKERLASLQL